MISELFQQALDLYHQSQHAQAETILHEVLKRDPVNERALLLLSICTQSRDFQIKLLKRVIEINPNNAEAKISLKDVEANKKKGKPKAGKAEEEKKSPDSDQPSIQGFTILSDNAPPEKKTSPRMQNIRPDEAITLEEENLDEQVDLDEPPDDAVGSNPSKKSSKRKQKPSRKPPHITIPEPEYVKRSPEDDFFHGFREGIELSARMETGMFGKSMIVDGISFSIFDGPPCIQTDKPQSGAQCNLCEFFTPQNCLLRYDEYLLDDIIRFVDNHKDRSEAFQQKRRIITKTIYRELKAHGRPLHYTIIAKIIRGRYPRFKLSAHSVYSYLKWHPELFERLGDGVYRAR